MQQSVNFTNAIDSITVDFTTTVAGDPLVTLITRNLNTNDVVVTQVSRENVQKLADFLNTGLATLRK